MVAPINLTKNAKVRSNFEKNRELLLNQNESYIKAMQPPEDDAASQGSGSPSRAASIQKFKKSTSQIKIEYLSKLFQNNDRGQTLNERPLKSPHPKIAKKLNVNHFQFRN